MIGNNRPSSIKVREWRKNIKSKFVAALGGKCAICGYNKCLHALEMHHIDQDGKDFGLGFIRANPKLWPKIIEELRKCVLLCANCHREVHSGMASIPTILPVFDERYNDYNFGLDKDQCPVCGKYKETKYKTCSRKCGWKIKINWENFNLIEMLKVKKLSIAEIADEVGASYGATKRKLKLMGLISVSDNKVIVKPTKEELESLIQLKPIKQIAALYGISQSGIIKWAFNYGLDIKVLSPFSILNRKKYKTFDIKEIKKRIEKQLMAS